MEEVEKTWQFTLTPAEVGRLPERLASAIRYAEARGLKIGTVTLTLEPQADHEPPEVRVRKWLKHCKRDCAMRATWPEEPARGQPDYIDLNEPRSHLPETYYRQAQQLKPNADAAD
jgi:hypothetical protein